jgi:hypothetical protein
MPGNRWLLNLIEKSQMSRACSTYEGEERCIKVYGGEG